MPDPVTTPADYEIQDGQLMGKSNSGKQINLTHAGITPEQFEEAKTLKAPLSFFAKVIEMTAKPMPREADLQDAYMQTYIDLANTLWANRKPLPPKIVG